MSCPCCQRPLKLLPLLIHALSPITLQCRDCKESLRFRSPAITLLIGIVWGILLSALHWGLLFLYEQQDWPLTVSNYLPTVLVTVPLTLWIAHALVIRDKSLVPKREAPASRAFALAFVAGVFVAFAGFAAVHWAR